MGLLVRFLIGGMVVTAFAVAGDMLKPESLGGVFAAAPTIALATLILTAHTHGTVYVGVEARSMVAGAAAFVVYASAVSFVMMRWRPKALAAAGGLLPVWMLTAAALWATWLRR